MNSLEVICLFLLFTPTAQFEMGNLEISDVTVKLTCPIDDDEVTWTMSDGTESKGKQHIIREYTDKNNGQHNCKNVSHTYYFYSKMKVCKGCVDLDPTSILLVIIADLLFTMGVIVLVCMCGKKKASPATPQRAMMHGRQTSAPPPPDPDYQPLNQATRSKDVYAEARRKF